MSSLAQRALFKSFPEASLPWRLVFMHFDLVNVESSKQYIVVGEKVEITTIVTNKGESIRILIASQIAFAKSLEHEAKGPLVNEELPQKIAFVVVSGRHLATPFRPAHELLRSEQALKKIYALTRRYLHLKNWLKEEYCAYSKMYSKPTKNIRLKKLGKQRNRSEVKLPTCLGSLAYCSTSSVAFNMNSALGNTFETKPRSCARCALNRSLNISISVACKSSISWGKFF